MYVVDHETLEAMVQQVVQDLPPAFRARVDNLGFAVEDRSSPEDERQTGTAAGSTLLGLYRGVPLPRRTSGYNLALPDLIVIFQQPLQRIARDREHLSELVTHTIHHEIAHYFGISDQRLRELGAY
ncbi:MAG: metallopeptidase family protein [Chloroflexi bacterium]|nr:metallopeptidase family protein [Chloroflexota bacterium]